MLLMIMKLVCVRKEAFLKRMRMDEGQASPEWKKGAGQNREGPPKQAKVATGHMTRVTNEDSDSESSPAPVTKFPTCSSAFLTRIVDKENVSEDD